jgi:hypothetical protein
MQSDELLGRVCFKAGLVGSQEPLSLERALSAVESLL